MPLPALQFPQMQDPLETAGKVMSLQNLLQQRQSNAMTLQVNQMRLQQMQQDMDDEVSAREIMRKHGNDLEKALPELYSTLGPEKGAKLATSLNQQAESRAKMTVTQLEQLTKGADYLGSQASAILSLPEDQRPSAYEALISRLPKEALQKIPAQYPGEAWMQSYVRGAMSAKEQAEMDRQRRLDEAPPKPTGDYAEFIGTYYPGWLEEKGLPKSALNEKKAYDDWKAVVKATKGDTSLNERLAQLQAKSNMGGLTKEEQAEKGGIEYSLGYVGRVYGPGYKAFTTPEGTTVLVHPNEGAKVVGGGLRPQYTAEERSKVSNYDEMTTQLKRLKELAPKHPGAIGYGQGWISELGSKITGAGGEEVAEMFRISNNVSDILLRARSGAQINEQEYARLRKVAPNPNTSETKFYSDLKTFTAEVERLKDRLSGKAPLVTSDKTSKPEGNRPPLSSFER